MRLPGSLAKTAWRGAAKLTTWALDQVPEVLLLSGAAATVYGVWQVYRPAGWIAAGLLALAAGWRLGRPPAPEVKRG